MKLNLFAFDNEDEIILQNSYNSIKEKINIKIVEDEIEQNLFLISLKSRMNLNPKHDLKIQNLFKLKKENGELYIGQLLLDKFYDISNLHGQSFERKYDFYIFGLCETSLNLGNSTLAIATKADKIQKKFCAKNIKVGNSTIFNEKYKIYTNRKTELELFLNDNLVNELNNQNDILIVFEESKIFFSFDNNIKSNQTRIIEILFEKMLYIK